MFSPYSPASDSEVGTLSSVVFAGAAEAGGAGVSLVFAVASSALSTLRETDEHAFNQIIKKQITTGTPVATMFHHSRGSLLLNTVFIVLLLFFQLPQCLVCACAKVNANIVNATAKGASLNLARRGQYAANEFG
jgi:hypothetical protein